MPAGTADFLCSPTTALFVNPDRPLHRCPFVLAAQQKHKYYSVAATAQWFFEGQRRYGTKGFKNAAASFAPGDLDVVRAEPSRAEPTDAQGMRPAKTFVDARNGRTATYDDASQVVPCRPKRRYRWTRRSCRAFRCTSSNRLKCVCT